MFHQNIQRILECFDHHWAQIYQRSKNSHHQVSVYHFKIVIFFLHKMLFLSRLFWSLVVLLSFIFCNILVAHFWFRYKSLATQITVATNHAPLSSLKLPAITFCSYNPLDANRSTIFIRQL